MDHALIAAALTRLDAHNPQAFPPSGQKYVAKVDYRGAEAVIKIIEVSGLHREVTLERARREVDLLARIDHPNVVRLLSGLEAIADDSTEGVAWLEQFLDGQDLGTMFGKRWAWPETQRMGLDVARGLAAMHSEKAVHRDLSPGNIRCTSNGRFVLMDPGLARHFERSSLTGTFQPGTTGYMTPEHVSGVRPSPASDIFGLGVLMYQCLSGQLPVQVGPDYSAYTKQLRDEQAPSIKDLRPDLAGPEAAIVDRCLERQSARRFLNGQELVAALEAS